VTATPSLVSIVDDDESVRESLPDLVRQFGFAAEAFASAEAFLSSEFVNQTSCLILDIAMPGMTGPELQRELSNRRPAIPIVFITASRDPTIRPRLLEQGAVESLTKPFSETALLNAIRDALERSRTALRHQSEMQSLRHCYASLTAREREVMALVVSGLLNKQVGGELGISEVTVKAHRGQVMRKMNADSLPDLVTMAARLGLQTAPQH